MDRSVRFLGRADSSLILSIFDLLGLVDKITGTFSLARLVLRSTLPLISAQTSRFLRCFPHLLNLLLLVGEKFEEGVSIVIRDICLKVTFTLHPWRVVVRIGD